MKKSELITHLNELGIRPSRKLGQNFLIDPNTLNYFVEQMTPVPNEPIVEIGAGVGNLTDALLQRGTRVTAIEYDVRLSEFLQRKYEDYSNITIINSDAARINYSKLLTRPTILCVGNLPYAASSVILARLLECDIKPKKMYFLLQKELAERLVAKPSNHTYGSISVRIQAFYDIRILKIVSPNVFWPIPKVDSAFVRFDRNLSGVAPECCKSFFEIVKLSFIHRRKKLMSNLALRFETTRLTQVFEDLDIGIDLRPEELTPQNFIALSTALFEQKP